MSHMLAQLGEICKSFVPRQLDQQVAADMYEEANTPFSLANWLLLKYGEFGQLVRRSARLDGNSEDVFKDVLCESLLSKFDGFVHADLDPETTARANFLAAEQKCLDTNARMASLVRGPICDDLDTLNELSEEIAEILGEFHPERWVSACSFGPGKSIGTDSERVSPYYKMSVAPTYCGADPALAKALFETCSAWVDVGKQMLTVAASKLRFVPKNAKTHRAILIEPIINLFAQKGIGLLIRARLKKFGCDLDHGQARQQRLARLGSLTGLLSTLDLKAASDTIAYSVVAFLLPRRWFYAMAAFRSPQCQMPGSKQLWKLSKFSSMGNGYTFELESLIFFAMARVSARRARATGEIGVYGDDVIVPTGAATANFIAMCDLLGFQLNPEKSHTTGYFRESCGGNYYDGRESPTLYLKSTTTDLRGAFLLANRLHSRTHPATCAEVERCFERGRRRVVAAIPRAARALKYPDTMGESDSGLATPVDELNFDSYDKDLQQWFLSTPQWVSNPIETRMENVWAAKAAMLYEVEKLQYGHRQVLREQALDFRYFGSYYRGIASRQNLDVKHDGDVRFTTDWCMTPHRGRLQPKLRQVRFYASCSATRQ